jgi:hypothetical protein
MEKTIGLLSLAQLEAWNLPPVAKVEQENDWIVVTFAGQALNRAPMHLPMAPARLKFRNWKGPRHTASSR